MDIAPKIQEILNSLTLDAQKAAKEKCEELSFDPNKGEITLDEAFINLTSCVNILSDAVRQRKLIQFPLTIQKELLIKLEAVSKFIVALIAGADEVINLVNSIEELTTAIWHHRLNSLSEGVLGFETKMNELKHQEVLLKQLSDKLTEGLATKDELISLLLKVKSAQTSTETASEEAKATAEKAAKSLETIVELSEKADANATATSESETAAQKHASSSKLSLAEIEAIQAKVKGFYAEVDTYREKITSTSADAGRAVTENKAQTVELITKLSELEKQIEKVIQDATGYSLFHAFQTRQGKVELAKNFWGRAVLWLLLGAVGIAALLAYWIGPNASLDAAFFLKLAVSIPIVVAITFCTVQYSRERRLEEEYAFKGAISLSLDPYQKLVSSIVDKASPTERQEFTKFILESIGRVFTSPTEKIFDLKEKEKIKLEKSLKYVAEIMGSAAKAAKP